MPNMRYANMGRIRQLPLLISALFIASSAFSQNNIPHFKDYPVDQLYNGVNTPLVLTKRYRTYSTKLKEAAREKPYFAGHYILTTWGCGTTCLMGAAIDAKTGKV